MDQLKFAKIQPQKPVSALGVLATIQKQVRVPMVERYDFAVGFTVYAAFGADFVV